MNTSKGFLQMLGSAPSLFFNRWEGEVKVRNKNLKIDYWTFKPPKPHHQKRNGKKESPSQHAPLYFAKVIMAPRMPEGFHTEAGPQNQMQIS